MNTEIEQTLEFDKIKESIARYTMSELGRSLVNDLKPVTDIFQIERMLNINSECKKIDSIEGGLPLTGLHDIRPILKKASVIGTILETEELLHVASTARVARNMKSFARDLSEKYPLIYEIIENLHVFPSLEEAINKSIDPDGGILDSASPELHRIRRQIVVIRDKITRLLGNILHSPLNQPAIQEDVITIRNDRYVIPVKQNLRASVPGVIQGRSASGITAFVEPTQVVELNNQLHELISDELREIRRILKELTDRVHQVLPELENTVLILADLDLINAKAIFCLKLGTTKPDLNDRGYIKLIQGRHPLLQMKINEKKSYNADNQEADPNVPEKVVPIDFHIGDTFNTLVITGPNTGGKTVALKTIGLLTLMMQSGLHVPAGEGCQMAVFNEVFADIGDEQSIEQNLSTFSSHITRVIRIIEQLDESSLILLDELGAGTEPSEGSALGMAMLDYLHSRSVRTIATTHHDSLKAHVHSQEGMENASVSFDFTTLKPTYEMRIGMPGSSNALKIADRLGLSKEIIDNARSYLSPQNVQITDLLQTVEEMQKGLEEQKRMADEKALSASKIQQEQEQLLSQLKGKRKEIEREALNEASRIVQKAKTLAENVIAEIQKEKASTESIRRTQRTLTKAREEITEAIQRTSHIETPENRINREGRKPKREELKIGDEVYVKSLQCNGILSTLPDAKDVVQVIAGNAKINVSLSEIRVQSKPLEKKVDSSKSNVVNLQHFKQSDISSILNIRGFRAQEAIEKADKFLDDASIAGLASISIIHGIGTGALREAVSNLLSEHPLVADFRPAAPNEGGHGVTVVQLKG
jgi:DNA mismatch repair protein MutS2